MQTKIFLKQNLTAFILIFLLVTSCEIQEDFKYKPSNTNEKLGMTAWEFIQSNIDFLQLKNAITRTGLEELYQNEERTFITPNNTAFQNYLQSAGYNSIEDIPIPILRNMLRYHIVKDRVIFTDPTITRDRPISYDTENGQVMFLSRNNNYIGQINQGTSRQWEIRTSNLQPTNGVIHAVNYIVYFSAPAVDNSEDPTLVRDTIFVKADAFVAGNSAGEEYANTNYGGSDVLRPKYSSPEGNSAYDRVAYLKFDFDEFKKEGIVVDMKLRLAVKFTTGDGYPLNLFKSANSNWTETGITFNNAPGKDGARISYLNTSKVSHFNFDITNYYLDALPAGLVSFTIESGAAPAGNKTDDLASKENTTLDPPMIIATLATGQNNLVVETNQIAAVAKGSSVVVDDKTLKISGAEPEDIIYTINVGPTKGWLVRGADIIGVGKQFTQADIQSLSLLYIHDGESTGQDSFVVSAKDRTGVTIDEIIVKLNID